MPETTRVDERIAFEGISSATVLKPGDKVLLTTDKRWSPAQFAEFLETIRKAKEEGPFGGIDFLVVSGIDSVTVEPGVWQERIEEMWQTHRRNEEWAAEQAEREG